MYTKGSPSISFFPFARHVEKKEEEEEEKVNSSSSVNDTTNSSRDCWGIQRIFIFEKPTLFSPTIAYFSRRYILNATSQVYNAHQYSFLNGWMCHVSVRENK